jgi:hypothetical protein
MIGSKLFVWSESLSLTHELLMKVVMCGLIFHVTLAPHVGGQHWSCHGVSWVTWVRIGNKS